MADLPDTTALLAAIAATWPAESETPLGPCLIRDGRGGGSRVSSAVATGPCDASDITAAIAAMRKLHQPAQFMIGPGDAALDAQLGTRGFAIKDKTQLYAAPIARLTAPKPPPVTSFQVWPPLEAQREIWAAGGITDARVAVMERAACPKASFLGRTNDRPAGTAYAGVHDGITMLHALEVSRENRRRGLAANLTRAVAIWGQTHGATHVALATTAANSAANALYTSLGMTIVGGYHYRIHPDDA